MATGFCRRFSVLALAVLAPLTSVAESLPLSVLILDQSDSDSAWFQAFSSEFRATLNAKSTTQISVYSEHLDFNRFSGPRHDDVVRAFLQDKFSKKQIGVIVAQGSGALDFLTRAHLWPNTPVVMAAVDDATVARLRLPSNVTGTTYRLTFRDAVASAKMLVPNLKRIALVGDPFERQAVRGHFKEEIPAAMAGLELIDLLGLPMTELLKRVAVLPEETAIIYTAINTDGAGVVYHPHEALRAVSHVANRPIVIDAETSVGYGGTGGLIVSPRLVGADTAELVLRVLDGQKPSDIPIAKGSFARPIFDWRELQRFGVDERRLPQDSEIRFRPPTFWDQYRWHAIGVVAVVLTQALMIAGLLLERRRRQIAEAESLQRVSELARMNRFATAGELSASIAHEIRQPLAAISISGQAGLSWLKRQAPNLDEVRKALEAVIEETHHADDVLKSVRAMFKQDVAARTEVNLNELVQTVITVAAGPIHSKNITVETNLTDDVQARVVADSVQLQQVILNLIMNAVEAMSQSGDENRFLRIRTEPGPAATVVLRVADSGPRVDPEVVKKMFQPFFTTKSSGMGMGLSICKTIIEAHGGQLAAFANNPHGMEFQITLPLHQTAR